MYNVYFCAYLFEYLNSTFFCAFAALTRKFTKSGINKSFILSLKHPKKIDKQMQPVTCLVVLGVSGMSGEEKISFKLSTLIVDFDISKQTKKKTYQR